MLDLVKGATISFGVPKEEEYQVKPSILAQIEDIDRQVGLLVGTEVIIEQFDKNRRLVTTVEGLYQLPLEEDTLATLQNTPITIMSLSQAADLAKAHGYDGVITETGPFWVR